jgi:trans-aconitate 2-methyltransferase
MSHTWDPALYLRYADDRGRPFVELLARVGAEDPSSVVDLGCGPGNLTALLARRWPAATVRGVDSSREMVDRARTTAPHLDVELADLRTWQTETPVDVLVSNATLQWVPGHLDLLPRLVEQVSEGGWLALQVPGNFDQPSHTLRDRLAADPRYAEHLQGVATPTAHAPGAYLERLAPWGREVDVWETTYLHVLPGEDPVFDWVSGTGARPTLQALPSALRDEFAEELRAGLRAAYPRTGHGTVLPFRRVFAVLRK